jgi:purine-nucleoside phosphorylase
MYKAFTAGEFKKMLSLPDDYHVDGLLTYGAWDEPKHHSRLCEAMDGLGIKYSAKLMEGFLLHALEIRVNEKRYWFAVLYGGALLSEYVHLASLFGSKKNIHIGSCGGLYPEMKSLDLVIPTWSYGNESTTRAYDREAGDFKHHADTDLSDKLENNLSEKHTIRKGPIITNQAMMGETWDDVKSWSDKGYYGVEMETATVFSVSKHFNVPAAALLYVSDNLIKGQTVRDDSHNAQKAEREAVKDDVYRAGVATLIG